MSKKISGGNHGKITSKKWRGRGEVADGSIYIHHLTFFHSKIERQKSRRSSNNETTDGLDANEIRLLFRVEREFKDVWIVASVQFQVLSPKNDVADP